ncbi:hypothetical protein C8J57DRAFT_1537088 [Mycena rebaudengoi]|nr:hypothetical protein C8J57DRAFT_1537088 [Mycena rebaudengoi]
MVPDDGLHAAAKPALPEPTVIAEHTGIVSSGKASLRASLSGRQGSAGDTEERSRSFPLLRHTCDISFLLATLTILTLLSSLAVFFGPSSLSTLPSTSVSLSLAFSSRITLFWARWTRLLLDVDLSHCRLSSFRQQT